MKYASDRRALAQLDASVALASVCTEKVGNVGKRWENASEGGSEVRVCCVKYSEGARGWGGREGEGRRLRSQSTPF